ncbi:MAG TPA: glycoside hydrolase family 3 protein [bacterium]|nr:glycoside hydrolase family 3 protein [bacterium]
MKRKPVFLLIVFLALTGMQLSIAEEGPAYLNPDLPVSQRVDDLISRMTLEEKISQMMDVARAIPRLGIPEYNWWNECLHGVARAGIATVFPQAIGLAATWNTDLMFEVADVTSTEARAKHHEFVRQGDFGRYKGLTMWSPNINIFRDPRWGRGQETYGEDPYLTGRMGVAFVKGLQGDDPHYLKVVSTPKHYAVHSGPEPDRHHFDAVTDLRDLYDTYLPAFRATVEEAGAWSVMCAYNRYLGEACCAGPRLLRDILRNDWGFEGYIVSDCGAIDDIYRHHRIVGDAAEASALSVKSGTDLECGNSYRDLKQAVRRGFITEAELDVALRRLFTARIRLGMFDPPERVAYARIPFEKNDCEAHRALSVRAARESLVLLKNDGLLPLKRDIKTIAVIGPNADNRFVLLGNYNGTPSKSVTVLEGIQNKVGKNTRVLYARGCNYVDKNPPAELVPAGVLRTNGQAGLRAEYYMNQALEGEPLHVRVDREIDSNWWRSAVPGLGHANFSVRWQGELIAPKGGNYRFSLMGDDGYRLIVNGDTLIDNWSDHDIEIRTATVSLKAKEALPVTVEYYQNQGAAWIRFEWSEIGGDPFRDAIEAAKNSDLIVFAGGIGAMLEGEEMPVRIEGFTGGDRTRIDLPDIQVELLKALKMTGKSVVLVLMSGSAVTVNWADRNLPAILQVWYPGQEGGTAIADVLFGDCNPAGRLPVTVYKSLDQLPPFEDYAMEERTYRYFTGDPLYPFGHGLSYTRFVYSELQIPDTVTAGEDVCVSVTVENAGGMAGDEVVQLYVSDVEASFPVPIRSLQGFRRIHLAPGQKKEVAFTLTPRQLAFWDDSANQILEPGFFEIAVGGKQPGFSGSADAETTGSLTGRFEVLGDRILYR